MAVDRVGDSCSTQQRGIVYRGVASCRIVRRHMCRLPRVPCQGKIEELERRITLWQQDKQSLRLMSIQLQSQMNNMQSTITNIQATARHNSNDLRNLVVRR